MESRASSQRLHHHLPELQAIRGLAAVIVVMHHCSFSFLVGGSFHFYSEALLNAHAAVVLFFVLSGYVLTRRLIGSKIDKQRTINYYIERAFRIYPAVWFALTLYFAYVTIGLYKVAPYGVSTWFIGMTSSDHSFKHFVRAAIGTSDSILPPLWSIVVELQASLIMPIIAIMVRRGVLYWALLQTVLMGVLVIRLMLIDEHWVILVSYLFAFGAGAGVCLFAPKFTHLPLSAARMIALAAFLIMQFFRLVWPGWRFLIEYDAVLPTLVEAYAGAVMLAVVASVPSAFSILTVRPLVYLGDISYSVYLLHWIIAATFVKIIYLEYPNFLFQFPVVATITLMATTLVATIPLATVCYKYVELPGKALGQRFTRRWLRF